jgi:hypothetical protein
MAYRFFRLDPQGRFAGVDIIEAADDRTAMLQAQALCSERRLPGFELWNFARPVGRFGVDKHAHRLTVA